MDLHIKLTLFNIALSYGLYYVFEKMHFETVEKIWLIHNRKHGLMKVGKHYGFIKLGKKT